MKTRYSKTRRGPMLVALGMLALAMAGILILRSKKTAAPTGQAEIEWVSIPGGAFLMGGERGPIVTVKWFHLARTPVTNRQYQACVDAGACTPIAYIDDEFGGPDQPAVRVSWDQADTFSKWVGGRLPTEAEWEYAARSAGKDWIYPWGNEEATCARAIIPDCRLGKTAPVCSRPLGNTEQGLCDMAGNVQEWVEGWWFTPLGIWHIRRGGSWSLDAPDARVTARAGYHGSDLDVYAGFRPAR